MPYAAAKSLMSVTSPNASSASVTCVTASPEKRDPVSAAHDGDPRLRLDLTLHRPEEGEDGQADCDEHERDCEVKDVHGSRRPAISRRTDSFLVPATGCSATTTSMTVPSEAQQETS